jgi:hypothetical protein
MEELAQTPARTERPSATAKPDQRGDAGLHNAAFSLRLRERRLQNSGRVGAGGIAPPRPTPAVRPRHHADPPLRSARARALVGSARGRGMGEGPAAQEALAPAAALPEKRPRTGPRPSAVRISAQGQLACTTEGDTAFVEAAASGTLSLVAPCADQQNACKYSKEEASDR